MLNLKSMLAAAAACYREKTAIVSGDRRLSYAELDEASNRLGNALLRIGVGKGDRVAMLLSNSPEFAIIYFGIVKTGAIAVPLDTKYKADELVSLLADCLPRVLVTESSTLEPLIPVLSRFKSIEHIIDLDSNPGGQVYGYREIMAGSSAQTIEIETSPEDIAHIAYTSGPSFQPQGVVLTHHCLLTEAAVSADGFQQTDKDIIPLFALPMYHMLGLVAILLASVYKGSTVVIVPGTGLSIGSFMAAIEREKATMLLVVPYIFALAVDMAEKEGVKNDLSSLRLCGSAGAPLPIDIIRRFKQYYGFDIVDFWGLTEAVCQVTCPPINGTGKLGSVGTPLPGWEVKIVDESGRELPLNQAGVIIVRGPMMTGYYHNPQATAEVIKDGWLDTGDIGRVSEDGFLFITDRKKDTIIVKGQNIHPADVEMILLTHPKIAEAVVMGVADELRGEVVAAIISVKAGETLAEQEIKRLCLDHMASYKVPKQVLFLDSLPRTAAGEIDEETIRERLSIPSIFSGVGDSLG